METQAREIVGGHAHDVAMVFSLLLYLITVHFYIFFNLEAILKKVH